MGRGIYVHGKVCKALVQELKRFLITREAAASGGHCTLRIEPARDLKAFSGG